MKPLPILEKARVSDDELRNWPLEYIRHLHIEMGQQCNVRCSMCYQTDFSTKTKLPDVAWKEHLQPVYQHLQSITMQGGEPTILPNCRELVQMIVRDYPHVTLDTVTNGVLWNGIWEESFLAQGSAVNFSLNAIDPDLYAKVVQFGRYEDVIANIDRMVRRRQETGSKLIMRTSTVVLEETVHELPKVLEWSAEHGMDQVLFHTDPSLSAKPKDTRAVQKFVAEAYDVAEKYPHVRVIALNEFDWFYATVKKIEPVRPRELFKRAAGPCSLAFDNLFVSYTGFARPCCKTWFPLGNLIEDSIEKVWNGRAAFLFRKRMQNLDFRDCLTACDLNANPIDYRVSQLRKYYWVARREPNKVVDRAKRKLGLTNAQLDLPVLTK